MERIEKLRQKMTNEKIEAVIISKKESLRYLVNFDEEGTFLLVTFNDAFILTSKLSYIDAKKKVKSANVIKIESFFDDLKNIIDKEGINKLGFEKTIPFYRYEMLKQIGINLIPITVEDIRNIKEKEELKKIKMACKITDQCYKHILGFVKVGMKEEEIKEEIIRFMKVKGAEKESFEPIVASGKNGASPHARATSKRLKENEFVTLDFGCFYQGYCSDMTRSFSLGVPSKEMKRLYQLVKKAQEEALKVIRPGVKASEVYHAANNLFKKYNVDNYFIHGLGHGFGLEIHEGISLNATSETILEEGMLVTVEPGLYIEKHGGIRIEDDVLVTKNGYLSLTKSSKKLFIL